MTPINFCGKIMKLYFTNLNDFLEEKVSFSK